MTHHNVQHFAVPILPLHKLGFDDVDVALSEAHILFDLVALEVLDGDLFAL